MSVIYADNENYKELISEGFVLVDFYSETCVPCKLFSKILENIEYELPFVNVVKVNTTKHPKLGNDNDITAVPTILFIKDGQELERNVGVLSEDEVKERVGRYYYG